jgi:hypothetical protein
VTKRKSSEPETTCKQIGVVSVDSVVITIGDPCRLVELEYEEMLPDNDPFKQIEQPAHGHLGDEMIPGAVTMRTGWGDGYYPVMAEVEDGVVKTVLIEFLSDDFVKAAEKHIAAQQKNTAPIDGSDYLKEALANTVGSVS